MSLNVFAVDGRIASDPVVRAAGNGRVLSFRFVYNSPFGDKKATFYNVSLWGNRADTLASMLTKGQYVVVTGRCEGGSYKDKDGNERQTIEINANDISLPPRSNGGGAEPEDTEAF